MTDKKIKIDIGCGNNKMEGFTGIDLDEKTNPDIVASALDLPFADNSVDEVYSAHLVEHFNPQEAQQFFNEVYRVLKKGCRATMKIDKDWSEKRLMKKDLTHKYRYKEKEILEMLNKFSEKNVKDKIYFFKIYQPRRKIFVELVK
ncbi:class I SAM-dependent methyltransferase [Candidatus Parcubacteria bacterium]|nr:class I SAM-dependent methyltransferase [Candidatus Parcubacteria bacterium]